MCGALPGQGLTEKGLCFSDTCSIPPRYVGMWTLALEAVYFFMIASERERGLGFPDTNSIM